MPYGRSSARVARGNFCQSARVNIIIMRVIARLDVKGPNVVKGVQFEALRVMGKPADFAQEYFLQGADELIYIDIVASLYRRENLLHIVREAAKSIFIPFTAGGGVRSIKDIHDLLQAGAEKVAINTAAVKRPEFITEAAQRFGSQCIVLSIEAKRRKDGTWEAYTDNGREATGLDAVEWAKRGEALGAGEILLTSVDREGTQRGLDAELVKAVSQAVSISVIASGGTSSPDEAAKSVAHSGADALAVATILHYGKANIGDLKDALRAAGEEVRPCSDAERVRRAPAVAEADVGNYNRFTLRQFGEGIGVDPAAGETDTIAAVRPEDADVVVIDYGINNVRSVAMACESLGKKVCVADTPDAIRAAKRLILPGVGAFGDGMKALREKGLVEPLVERATAGVPLLGICLGMQLLFSQSEEFGLHEGLDLIPGKVVMFPDPAKEKRPGYHLPHIGWGTLTTPEDAPTRWNGTAFSSLREGSYAYFVHSLFGVPEHLGETLATSTYCGIPFCAAVQRGSITGAQFHPEKSGATGLALLKGFCEGGLA